MFLICIAAALAGALDLGAAKNESFATHGWPNPATMPVAGGWTAGESDSVLITRRNRVELPVDDSFDWFDVAWGVKGPANLNQRVAKVRFHYSDETAHELSIRNGVHISRVEASGSVVFGIPLRLDDGHALTVSSLPNPHPHKTVAQVTIEGRGVDLVVLAAAVRNDGEARPSPTPLVHIPVEDGWEPELSGWRNPRPQRDSGRTESLAAPLRVQDNHFVDDRGQRVRLWGVNLVRLTAMPTPDVAPSLADGLVEMGFNVARLHRVDGPDTGLIDEGREPDGSPFNAEMLDRFDFMVHELEKRDVRIVLEIASGRRFSAKDGVPHSSAAIPSGHKLVPMWNDDWNDEFMNWTRAWLGRTNPHSGLAYADDPGVAFVELSNEHSLVLSWFTGSIDGIAPELLVGLDEQWNAWLSEKYPTTEAIEESWGVLLEGETRGQVGRFPRGRAESRYFPDERARNLMAFYQMLEAQFYDQLETLVRDKLGFDCPITGTTVTTSAAVASIQAGFDVHDMHSYFDKTRDGMLESTSALRNTYPLIVLSRAVGGGPVTLSELNHDYPSRYRAEAPILWAALASVQDWDGVMWFNWANRTADMDDGSTAAPHEIATDIAKWAQMAVASELYKSGAIAPATGSWVEYRSDGWIHAEGIATPGTTNPAFRDLGFALSHKLRRVFGPVPEASLYREGELGGEVGWWRDSGHLLVKTAAIEAHVGPRGPLGVIGAGPRELDRMKVELDGFAAVSLMALEGDLGSGSALLTVVGESQNAGYVGTPSYAFVGALGNGAQQVTVPSGRIVLEWDQKPTVTQLFADGQRGSTVKVRRAGSGQWAVAIDPDQRTLWWLVE